LSFGLNPETISSAPGKIILFGEHAVVYGRPAIAVPVTQVNAQATIVRTESDLVAIDAPDVSRHYTLGDAPSDDPIAAIIRLTCEEIRVEPKGFSLRICSTIPVARGLGSGAAVSVATARAIAQSFSHDLSREQVSALALQVEKLHHGTPSGIDNTVIAFNQPIYFIKGQPPETCHVARPFQIAIADTGISSPTKIAVGDVRREWQANRAGYEARFDAIGDISRKARIAIERGEADALGSLMLQNQELLQQIGVSSEEIERIVDAAIGAGAEGAKLSGAGRGGNVIALVDQETRAEVERAMKRAGAVSVIVSQIE
jgi:mevalonate kinase